MYNYQQIEVDTHTHTVLSGHAWSTLNENCIAASSRGLKGLCLTEHGPAMDHSLNSFSSCSLGMIPEFVHGVRVFTGMEFNIINFNGDIDQIEPVSHKHIHFGIASMHDVCMPLGSKKQHTEAYIAALNNPLVDILGHPGYAYFPVDPKPIVLEARRLDKLIEVNNNSFRARKGSEENCLRFIHFCKQYEVRICVSSDAHFDSMVGVVPRALKLLEEAEFPAELILNRTYEGFVSYLSGRGRI